MTAGDQNFLLDLVGKQWIENYCGLWAMEESRFSALVARIEGTDLRAHIVAARGSADPYESAYAMIGENIAQIDIQGTMTKRGSSFGGGGTVAVRDQLRRAARDSVVEGIMLRVESPGGTVSGTAELADAIRSAAAVKPVHTFIEDIGASAALWASVQASHISANEMANVGSIGTLMAVADYSRAYENAGVKVHVISTGPYKGAGVPGSTITEEQLAYFREEIAKVNEYFLNAVAAGRKMPRDKVNELATGRVWLASEAKQIGLIDSVETFDAAIERLQAAIPKPVKGRTMTATTTAPSAATVQEIEAACPGATGDFVVAQLRLKATAQEASIAWASEQQKQIAAMNEQLAAERKRAEEAEKKSQYRVPGNDPLASTGGGNPSEGGMSATEEWKSKLKACTDRGMSNLDAAQRVNSEYPGLNDRRLAEWTPKPRMKI